MNDDEAIVRELAARGPCVAESDALGDVCAMCGAVNGLESPLAYPASHEPWCLWRRACERYPSARPPANGRL